MVYKATSVANEQYLQTLYKQMQAANMACECDSEDEEWLTYVEEGEKDRRDRFRGPSNKKNK